MNGVFWDLGNEKFIAVPFTKKMKADYPDAINGDAWDFEKLWNYVKPDGCDKPYNFFKRGRIDGTDREKGKVVLVNATPGTDFGVIRDSVSSFQLGKCFLVTWDDSEEYRCFTGNVMENSSD